MQRREFLKHIGLWLCGFVLLKFRDVVRIFKKDRPDNLHEARHYRRDDTLAG